MVEYFRLLPVRGSLEYSFIAYSPSVPYKNGIKLNLDDLISIESLKIVRGKGEELFKLTSEQYPNVVDGKNLEANAFFEIDEPSFGNGLNHLVLFFYVEKLKR